MLIRSDSYIKSGQVYNMEQGAKDGAVSHALIKETLFDTLNLIN